jgi:hypothetical protein
MSDRDGGRVRLRALLLGLVVGLAIGCGSETYSGECVYVSGLHSRYDAAACEREAEAQGCVAWELEDRSDEGGEDTIIACVYSDCALDEDRPDFDCEAFRGI